MSSPFLFKIIFVAVLLVALQRSSEVSDILADLVHLQKQSAVLNVRDKTGNYELIDPICPRNADNSIRHKGATIAYW